MTQKSGMAQVAPRLQRAREVASKLAAETETLNTLLKVAEQGLRELNLGITAYAEFPAPEGMLPGEYGLFFGKDADAGWCLEVKEPEGGNNFSFTSVHSVSRDLRVCAANVLPTLIDDMLREAEIKLTEVTKAARNVGAVVDHLEAES
jgi:hypothetical protein